jgi:hypothetical protein
MAFVNKPQCAARILVAFLWLALLSQLPCSAQSDGSVPISSPGSWTTDKLYDVAAAPAHIAKLTGVRLWKASKELARGTRQSLLTAPTRQLLKPPVDTEFSYGYDATSPTQTYPNGSPLSFPWQSQQIAQNSPTAMPPAYQWQGRPDTQSLPTYSPVASTTSFQKSPARLYSPETHPEYPYSGYGFTNPDAVPVRGYFRSNGTYVAPHFRTAPNFTQRDNFSTIGNRNPFTGRMGTHRAYR